MFRFSTARLLIPAVLALAACASTPNDVSPGQQAFDAQSFENRQAVLNGQIGEAQSFNGQGATQATPGLPANAGATGDVTFLDPNSVEGIAAGAIAEAEAAGQPQSGGVFDNIQPQQAGDVLPPPLIPRVAAFALRTTHLPGERQWRRNPFRRGDPNLCLQFQTQDQAQDAFLRDGGPERDPNGLDPDGDGFVCGFDPRALRAEAAAGNTAPTFGTPETPLLPQG